MSYLLDTHAFLWSIFDPDQISEKARRIITNSDEIMHVSVVTFWEISLKYAAGKIDLLNVLPEEFPEIARQLNFDILSLAESEAASFYRLPKLGHKDPFDRLIVRQAIHYKMTLISKDSKLKEYRTAGLKILW